MPKMTLLDIVQNILSDMDSDEVNSISDTVESLQVAGIVKETYYFLIDNKIVPELHQLYTIDSLGDNTRPNIMKLPASASFMEWVKYDQVQLGDTQPNYVDVDFLEPKDFLDFLNGRNPDDNDVDVITDVSSSTKFLVRTDKAPDYWTTFDDEHMVFDSYDSEVDTTLQSSKTQAFGQVEPSWTMSDTFVPDIDASAFTMLVNEAKSQAFITLKQVSNSKAEQRYRKQLTKMQNDKYRFKDMNELLRTQPNYGR